MRFVLAVTMFALAALQTWAVAAQAWYWCEPARAYYPYVSRCPVPWQLVNPSSAGSRPDTTTEAPAPAGQLAPAGQTTANRFPSFGDGLDDWCKTVQLPSSIAICSDAELRALALERQHAYDEAKARLGIEQQKGLLADQNSWVRSYPRACGLTGAPPLLPLMPGIKDCMAEAGRARLTYLRGYGVTAPTTPAAVSPTLSTTPPAASGHIGTSLGSSEASRADNGGLVLASVLVAIVGIIAVRATIRARVRTADRRRRIEQACAYINAVNQRRCFPEMPVNVNLQPGEFGLVEAPALLSEMRSHRYSTGARVRIAKGIWVGSRQYHSYRTRDIVDRGTVVITTRRIAFTGASKTAHTLFRDLVSIEGDIDRNIIHTGRRQNAIVIHYSKAALGLVLIRFFASSVLADNRLPDGWQLTAHANGDQITLNVSKSAAVAA